LAPTRWPKLLGVKNEEREALGLTTIGAIDRPKVLRERERAAAKRRRDQAMRASGPPEALPLATYGSGKS
jgi:hypothetical protein